MRTRSKLTSIVVLVLVSVAAFGGPKLPDDVLGIMEVRGLDKAMGQVSAIAKPLGIPLEQEALAAMLSMRLSASGLAGIDRRRAARIVVMTAKTQGSGPAMPGKPEGAIIIPLTDNGATYVKSLKAAYEKAEKLEGIWRLQNPVGQGALFRDMNLAVVNKHIVISDKNTSVTRVVDYLRKGTIRMTSRIPVAGTIRVLVNVKSIVVMAEAVTAMMGGAGGGGQNAPDPMAPMKSMLGAAKQVESVSVGLEGGRDNITLVVRVDPVAETLFAKTVAKLKPPTGMYTSLLPAKSPLIVSGSGMNVWDDVMDAYIKWLDELYAQIGAMTGDKTMETMWQSLRGSISGAKGMYSGEFAYGLLASKDGKALGFVQAVAVTDPAEVKKMMEKSLTTINEVPNMPFKVVAREPREHRGVKISRYKYEFDFGDAAAAMPPQVSEFMDKLSIEAAFVGKSSVSSVGSEKAMNLIIDRLKTGAGSSGFSAPRFNALFPLLTGSKPISTWTMDVLATVKGCMGLVPNADLSLIQEIPDGKGKLGGYCVEKEGALELVTRVAMSEILAVMSAVGPIQKVGTKLMAGVMGGAGGAGGGQADTGAACAKNLRLITAAKQVYALEAGAADNAVPPVNKLLQYFPGQKMPVCPEGGNYTIKAIKARPTCSHPGHALQ